MTTPVFAVVGRPNKGKSSIVATLARDDAVYIDAKAGSTKEAHSYPMKVDGETLYELVDTPGLQRARRGKPGSPQSQNRNLAAVVPTYWDHLAALFIR